MRDHTNSEELRPEKSNDVDLKYIVGKVFGNWHWYVISGISFIILGILFIITFAPKYDVTAKLMVNGNNSKAQSGMPTEMSVLSDLGMFSMESNVNNELAVLHSKTLIKQTIYDLQLNVQYQEERGILYREIYTKSPFYIKLLSLKEMPELVEDPQKYDITIDKNKVHFEDENTDSTFTATWGDTLKFYYGSFVLLKNPLVEEANPEHQMRLRIASYGQTYLDYNEDILGLVTGTDVTTIDLTLPTTIKPKGEETLRHLINLYVQSSIRNNNIIADSTIAFIDQRLSGVSSDLGNIESNIESFKKTNEISDLDVQSKTLVGTSIETNKLLSDQEVQISVVRDLASYLEDETNNKRVMPTTAPIKDPSFVNLLDKYNTYQLQRQELLVNSTENNPSIKTLDLQTAQLRGDLLRILRSYEQGLVTGKNDLTRQTSAVASSIRKVPTQEKLYLEFARKQSVLQSLYTYLLTTREQTAVSKSNNISPIRIIDAPAAEPIPYFPNPLIVFLVAFVLALLVPSATIFIRELLNTKVLTPEDIQGITDVPVISRVSHSKSKAALVISQESRSAVAEQFRTMRTNMQYLLTGANEKTILVTSSMGGEGKSFVAINFGMALALSGKKVLLVEMDLRKPKLSAHLNLTNTVGITNFIVSDLKLNDVIKPSGVHENCWVLSSGNIPPNPSELITHEKVADMFAQAKEQFDFIVIDTPPVGLVTDAQLVGKYADITFYVVRQKFTLKRQIEIIDELAANDKLPKPNIILNDVRKLPGYNYGTSKYEYGYYEEKRKGFFKRIFSRKKS